MTALMIALSALALLGAPIPPSSDAAPAVSPVGLPVPLALKDKPVPPLLSELGDMPVADTRWPRSVLPVDLPEPETWQGGRGCSAAAGIALETTEPTIGYRGVVDVTFTPVKDATAAACGISDTLKAAARR